MVEAGTPDTGPYLFRLIVTLTYADYKLVFLHNIKVLKISKLKSFFRRLDYQKC